MNISSKKHNSGWFWPLVGIFIVVLFIWWISGNQPEQNSYTEVTGVTQVQKTLTAKHTTTTTGTKQSGTDVVSVAASISNGSAFSSWLNSTGVASELSRTGTYTLFLPTDSAIAGLAPGTFKNLSAAEQKRFVEYHIIAGKVIDAEAQVAGSIQTLSRDPLNFTRRPGQSALVGSSVIVAKYQASNGVVYVVNGVLIPPQRLR